MKLEKRGELPADNTAELPSLTPEGGRKPVLLYLAVLFVIALAVIVFSFALQQRNDTIAALRDLQNQVETFQQLQDVEAQYEAVQDENEALQGQVEELQSQADAAERRLQAMSLLWALEQRSDAGDIDTCAELMAQLQEEDLYLSLPGTGAGGSESPLAAYHRIAAALAAAGNDA